MRAETVPTFSGEQGDGTRIDGAAEERAPAFSGEPRRGCSLLGRAARAANGEEFIDRTTLVVAHRLSTIRNAGRIAVLDGGSLTELGSHDELLECGGIYARLWRYQFQRGPEPAALEA